MGHTYQDYRGKSQVFRDGDLTTVVSIAIYVISTSKSFDDLQPLSDEWRVALERAGPGTLNLNLDRVIDQEKRNDRFEPLLQEVEKWATQYGAEIPKSVMNGLDNPWTTYTGDYPVSRIMRTVEQIRALIK